MVEVKTVVVYIALALAVAGASISIYNLTQPKCSNNASNDDTILNLATSDAALVHWVSNDAGSLSEGTSKYFTTWSDPDSTGFDCPTLAAGKYLITLSASAFTGGTVLASMRFLAFAVDACVTVPNPDPQPGTLLNTFSSGNVVIPANLASTFFDTHITFPLHVTSESQIIAVRADALTSNIGSITVTFTALKVPSE